MPIRITAAALLLAGCIVALAFTPALAVVRAIFENDQLARWIALAVWTPIAGALTIPARRRLFGQPFYVDDLLFAAWLLTLNRVCFSVQALVHNDTFADLTRWSGIGAGLFYAWVVSSYIWPKAVPGLRRA